MGKIEVPEKVDLRLSIEEVELRRKRVNEMGKLEKVIRVMDRAQLEHFAVLIAEANAQMGEYGPIHVVFPRSGTRYVPGVGIIGDPTANWPVGKEVA